MEPTIAGLRLEGTQLIESNGRENKTRKVLSSRHRSPAKQQSEQRPDGHVSMKQAVDEADFLAYGH